jgi:hypothetical protein
MYHDTISWMIAGGERVETREDRRQARHRAELRIARAQAGTSPATGGRDILARFRGLVVAPPSATVDCCAA